MRYVSCASRAPMRWSSASGFDSPARRYGTAFRRISDRPTSASRSSAISATASLGYPAACARPACGFRGRLLTSPFDVQPAPAPTDGVAVRPVCACFLPQPLARYESLAALDDLWGAPGAMCHQLAAARPGFPGSISGASASRTARAGRPTHHDGAWPMVRSSGRSSVAPSLPAPASRRCIAEAVR